MSRWLLFDVTAAGLVGVLAFATWGYPWQLAVLTGVAAGALAYATRRTYFNVRSLQATEPFSLTSSPSSDSDGSGDGEEGEGDA